MQLDVVTDDTRSKVKAIAASTKKKKRKQNRGQRVQHDILAMHARVVSVGMLEVITSMCKAISRESEARLRAELERWREESERWREESERWREESKRWREESKRRREELATLRAEFKELERKHEQSELRRLERYERFQSESLRGGSFTQVAKKDLLKDSQFRSLLDHVQAKLEYYATNASDSLRTTIDYEEGSQKWRARLDREGTGTPSRVNAARSLLTNPGSKGYGRDDLNVFLKSNGAVNLVSEARYVIRHAGNDAAPALYREEVFREAVDRVTDPRLRGDLGTLVTFLFASLD